MTSPGELHAAPDGTRVPGGSGGTRGTRMATLSRQHRQHEVAGKEEGHLAQTRWDSDLASVTRPGRAPGTAAHGGAGTGSPTPEQIPAGPGSSQCRHQPRSSAPRAAGTGQVAPAAPVPACSPCPPLCRKQWQGSVGRLAALGLAMLAWRGSAPPSLCCAVPGRSHRRL